MLSAEVDMDARVEKVVTIEAAVDRGWTPRDVLAFALLYAQLAFAFWSVPDSSLPALLAPTGIAFIGAVATTAGITLLRLAGRGGSRAERWLLAVFLAGMPLIYV